MNLESIKKVDYTSKEQMMKLFDMYEEELYENTDTNRIYAKEIVQLEEPFYNSLTEEDKQKYDKICDLKVLNGSETDRKIFAFGFSLAVKLILESIS